MKENLAELAIDAIIASHLNIEAHDIKPEQVIADIKGIDSLDFVEIIMRCEEEFDITVDDNEADKIKTVQDLYTAIETKMAEAQKKA